MPRRYKGFTLLEILVALAVLGLAMGALLQTAGGFVLNQAYMRDRTMAEWVARNVLIQQQLSDSWPDVGQKKDQVDFAEREWEWVMQVTQAPEKELRRLDIEVFVLDGDESEKVLAKLTGFVEKR